MSSKKPEKKRKSPVRLPDSVPKTGSRPVLPRGVSKTFDRPMQDAARQLGRARKVH